VSQPHRARRLALQGLHCLDAQGAKVLDLVEAFVRDSRDKTDTVESAIRMLRGTYEDREAIDALIAAHARHWQLGRLAAVDRNILRLGVHELRGGRTPPAVVITEAMRLAREFSTAESPRFVNGILDAIARELRAQGGE